MDGALSHVRVLDLSRVLAGPWCSQILGDLGADVVKIEPPGRGDDTRGWGPPYARDAAGQPTDQAAYFLSANRNKRSLTLDLSTPAGQKVARRLARRADVVIENFKVGGLARFGLDYASLAAENRRLVYCSITGFGQDGPAAGQAGYDFLIQGMGGLMSVTGTTEPTKVGVAVADLGTGLYATVAILAALVHRDRTGQGQHIDLALLDTQVALLANQALGYLCSGVAPGLSGNAHPSIAPYQTFATADGTIIVAVGNDGQFGRLCAYLDCPELAADGRFATNRLRAENRQALGDLLGARFRTRSSERCIAALTQLGVPCGPIHTIAETFADPQVRHRGLQLSLPHPTVGSVPSVASPLRLSATPVAYRRPPPLLGEHTVEILQELGYSEAEIRTLQQERTV